MRQWYHKVRARLTGRNSLSTPKDVIMAQMLEPRALPIGRQDFHDWADRIIAGALLPAKAESQKFVLADMLLHLGPTEDHKSDAHFIHCLRKFAINQVAITMRQELHEQEKAKLAKEAAETEGTKELTEEAPTLQ